jgi:hypothetical protein
MQTRGYIYMISFSAMVAGSCKKNYSPAASTQGYNYLVVEGVISAGGDSENILSNRKTGVCIPFGQLHAVYRPVYRDSTYAVGVYEYDHVDCRYHNHGSNAKPFFWK